MPTDTSRVDDSSLLGVSAANPLSDLEMLGIRPASEGGVLFCGVELQEYAISGVTYQWPRGSHLLWKLEFSRLGPLSDMDVKDAITAALKEISACCDVTHAMATQTQVPNLLVTTRRLDGGSGVLADCQIPVGNVGPGTTLIMRIDDSESWGLVENPPNGLVDLYRVGLHELEHFHGLGHRPPNNDDPALIAPLYNPRMRNLQAADKAELVRRYGPPKQVPKPVPGPAVPPGLVPVSLQVELAVEAFGHVYRAKGNVKR